MLKRMLPLFCSTSFAMQIICDARRRISIPPPLRGPIPHLSTSFYSTHLFRHVPLFRRNSAALVVSQIPVLTRELFCHLPA
jgi:hypothetical protein